jgi:HD-GYP domain-containing protein (c-di-GMP phosphodiesterase class II)
VNVQQGDSWLKVLKKGKSLDHTSVQHMISVSLLASGDNTEIIHHQLNQGTYWTLEPESPDGPLEYLYVLQGSLRCYSPEAVTLSAGDCIAANPALEQVVFLAMTDTEFLYVSSKPIYHLYSDSLERVENLAIEIEKKDGYTSDHCNRIMNMSVNLGKELKLSPSELVCLQHGSFLHDVGKVKIPDSILNKPGPLSKNEWDEMKLHTIYGHQLLLDTGLDYLVQPSTIVLQHHERFNGSGYPNGLKQSEIHIGAAIVAVADSYDAMISDRVYRKGRTKSEAIAELKDCSGVLYQPDVVKAFITLYG